MNRTIWDWLEIEATKDKRLIKRAYAEQSKKYHPEDAPEEATQLRNAYKTALAYAESDTEKQSFPHDAQEDISEEVSKASSGSRDDEYQYDLSGQQKKTDSPKVPSESTDDEYQYTLNEQAKTDAESSQTSERVYRYDSVKNNQTDTPRNDNISYELAVRGINAAKQDRIQKLHTCFKSIYENKSYNDNVNKWLEAVNDCYTEEDFKDVNMVSAVLTILENMPPIPSLVWYGLEQDLFRYSSNSAEWRWIKREFRKSRTANDSYENSEETYQRSVYSENQNATGDTKVSVTSVLKIIAVVVVIIRLLSRFM